MAVAAQKNVALALMQKTLERQQALARIKLKFVPKQVEQVILNNVQRGIVAPYNELVKVLRNFPLNDDNFRYVIEDCLTCVVLLGKNLKPFVDVICELEWVDRSEELVELYSRFLLNLVTAHTYHCAKVMSCLVRSFKAQGIHWEGSPDTEQVNKWSNVHTIIAQIVAIIPMTSDLLMQTVVQEFPYYKSGSYMNRAYIHNLIWMSKYLPALREQLMMVIINRMIIMDVNIVEHQKSKPLDTQFEMDVEETDEISDALDYSMLEVLRWLEDERDPILSIMCRVFETVVLPTYGIRHVQFLLVYTISISQVCADRTLAHLWTVAAGLQSAGPGASAPRRTAASHLAGVLARCVRVPNTRLIHYLRSMAEWCHSYITAAQEATSASDNIKAHAAFHSMCHAIFYLVAFKHHHLFGSKENVNFVESLNLPRLVTSGLNPLRTCPPAVTRAFSAVTRAHQVAYCQAVVERNQRHTLHHAVHYDQWFPYDPYTLPRSGKIIWPLCIEYKDWPTGDDETQYSGMTKKLDPEEDDFLMHASPVQRYANSLSNCISPGFKSSENIHLS